MKREQAMQRRSKVGNQHRDNGRSLERRKQGGLPAALPPPSPEALEFIEGRGMAARAPYPPGDNGECYHGLANPVLEGLLHEHRDHLTTSTRMVIEMAAQSYADWTHHVGFRRHIEEMGLSLKQGKDADRYQRLIDQSFKRVLACLEFLGRPRLRNLQVAIGTAGNVNFGEQVSSSGSPCGADTPSEPEGDSN